MPPHGPQAACGARAGRRPGKLPVSAWRRCTGLSGTRPDRPHHLADQVAACSVVVSPFAQARTGGGAVSLRRPRPGSGRVRAPCKAPAVAYRQATCSGNSGLCNGFGTPRHRGFGFGGPTEALQPRIFCKPDFEIDLTAIGGSSARLKFSEKKAGFAW